MWKICYCVRRQLRSLGTRAPGGPGEGTGGGQELGDREGERQGGRQTCRGDRGQEKASGGQAVGPRGGKH